MRFSRKNQMFVALRCRFQGDARGSVAVTMGLALTLLLGAIGISIDLLSLHHKKTRMQNALDAATLAAGRNWRLTTDLSQANAVLTKHYAEQVADGDAGTATISTADAETFSIEARVSASYNTAIMSLFGIHSMPVNVKSAAISGSLDNAEIAMMMDLSSSMTGSKFHELQTAARDFITVLKPDGPQGDAVRIALAPFASGVNVGAYYTSVVDPLQPPGTPPNTCVALRTTSNVFTDDPPAPGAFVNRFVIDDDWPCLASTILPLERDRNRLLSHVSQLKLSSGTEGEIGTAWAWYLLSPKWNSVWPSESQPEAYGAERNKKIAVLMTDGENFTRYFPQDTGADSHALQLCEAMKAQGITVFTVGFEVDAVRANNLLRDCASSSAHYYSAQGAGSLKAAFREIATSLIPLRLTQ
jgi:Flp pilus assembly protein TadG